jgi:hypothetical protein
MPFTGFAQSKLNFDLIFKISGVSNSSVKPKTNSGTKYYSPVLFDSLGSPIVITPSSGNIYTVAAPKTSPVKCKGKFTAGFTIGGKMTYDIYKKLGIGIGASISYFKAVRSTITTSEALYSNISFYGALLSSSGNWDSTRSFSAGTYTYSNGPEREDKFQFVTLNIPLSINYSIAKWEFEAAITASIILNSKYTQATDQNSNLEISAYTAPQYPYDPQPSPENETKSFFSLSVSPQYQISNKLNIGIEYSLPLSSSYSTNWYSKGIYPDMKTSSLGLKILYKLK